MSKLVIEINGESRKAVVTKDTEASVICSLKKESNEATPSTTLLSLDS